MQRPSDLNEEMSPPTAEAPPDGDAASPVGGRLMRLLLDPRSLNVLMLAGSGLLALGLVLWLVVIGVFENPLYAAVGLGAGNLGLLGGGVWLAARSRYQTAGRAVAMLACLLLPLNLWFYDAQGLVTLADGGNLWLPALVCCVLYAGVARVLKDSLFVYPAVAGVAMTGLVFLADGNVARFWEILAPSTLLVALGMAAVFAERLFPLSVGDARHQAFTRGDFGLAFFRAGHALLASGLGVLLAGRLAGRLYGSVFDGLGWFAQPDVATAPQAKLAACGLALCGAWAYGCSYLGRRDAHRYLLFSLLSLAWSGLVALDLLGVAFTEELLVGLLAVMAVGLVLAQRWGRHAARDERGWNALRVAANVAAASSVALLATQMLRGVWAPWLGWLTFDFTWGYLLAGATALGAALVVGANPADRASRSGRYAPATLAAVAVVGGLVALLNPGAVSAWWLAPMCLPALAWAGRALSVSEETDRREAWRSADLTLRLVAVLLAPFALLATTPASLVTTVWLMVLAAGVAAASGRRASGVLAVLAGLAACGQGMWLYQVGAEVPLLLVTLACAAGVGLERVGLLKGVAGASRLALVFAVLGGGLLAGNRLLAHEADLLLLATVVAQTVLTGVAAALSRKSEGRHGLVALAVAQVVVSGLVLNAVSTLDFGQRLELFLTAVGVGLVTAGLVSWRRETLDPSDGEPVVTDAHLWLGSLLASVPATLGLLDVRLDGGAASWVMLHEVGVLTLGVALVFLGVLCRLRATTLAGAGALAVYLLSLLTLVHLPDRLENVAFYLMAGGGALFGAAVLLSVYRDRLMAVPENLREGRGVFAVLKWR